MDLPCNGDPPRPQAEQRQQHLQRNLVVLSIKLPPTTWHFDDTFCAFSKRFPTQVVLDLLVFWEERSSPVAAPLQSSSAKVSFLNRISFRSPSLARSSLLWKWSSPNPKLPESLLKSWIAGTVEGGYGAKHGVAGNSLQVPNDLTTSKDIIADVLVLNNFKGIVPQKMFLRLNLIFWIVMGCGIAIFGRRGLKAT